MSYWKDASGWNRVHSVFFSTSPSQIHYSSETINYRGRHCGRNECEEEEKKNETVLLHPQIIISSSPGHSKIKIKPKQDQNANSKQAINGTCSAFAEYKISPNCRQQRGAAFRITGKQHVAAWSLKRRGDCLIHLTLESPVSRTACVVPLGKMSAYI